MKRWAIASAIIALGAGAPPSLASIEEEMRGAAELAGSAIAHERAAAEPEPPPRPPGPPIRVLLRGKIDPAIQRAAQRLLSLPFGAERIREIDGVRYVFCVEPHFRKPGSRDEGPFGWHKGVTVYELK
jgi:hypothetical protein